MMPQEVIRHPPTIAVVTHYFPSHGGGIELVADHLVAEYLDQGFRVDWFASATDPAPASKEKLEVHRIPASNLVERLTQLPYPLWSPIAIPRLWHAIGKADAVHVHEHLYVGSILAICIARLRSKPVVLTQHMGDLSLRTRPLTAMYKVAAKLLAWPLMRLPTSVAFVSANVRRFFISENTRTRTATLVFNGLDSSTFHYFNVSERAAVRRDLGVPVERPIVLFAGRFVRKKGLNLLRNLASQMSEVSWLFAGTGPEDPGLWNFPNVKVLGHLSQKELALIMGTADVLILPSSGEGFPLVVQEALACGTAVLSTPEVASACPPAARFIATASGSGWPDALRRLLLHAQDEHERQLRAKGAAALWSWHACAASYVHMMHIGERTQDGSRCT